MKIEICENCEHFIQHYVNSKHCGIIKTRCGYCIKNQMRKKDCQLFEKSPKEYEDEISILCLISSYEKKFNRFLTSFEEFKELCSSIKKETLD